MCNADETIGNTINKISMDKLKSELIRDEGLRLTPYKCTAGKLTIGIGRNIEDKGITEDEAHYMLYNDIRECLSDCVLIFGDDWKYFSDARKRVFVNMRFNLGPKGFRSFKNTIRYAKMRDWIMVAQNMRNSRWYNQVGDRAKRLIKMVIDG